MRLPRLERHLPELYLVIVLGITTLLAFTTAPFFAPDEANQSCRAISLAHGLLIAKLGPDEAGAPIDTGALAAMDGFNTLRMAWEHRSDARPGANFRDRPYGPVTPTDQHQFEAIRWTHQTTFVPFGNTAVYPPILYTPAILGWRLAESFNLSLLQSVHLARLFSGFAACWIAWLALRLSPSPWLLLPFLLLPSAVFLFASSSQDAILLPVAALLCAIVARPIAAGRDYTLPELALAAALIALCATARPPYVPFALLLFLPMANLTGTFRPPRAWTLRQQVNNLAPHAIAMSAVLAVCALWRHLVSPLGIDTADEANPDLQTAFLLHHPFRGAVAVINGAFSAVTDFFTRGLYVVGWNDLLPHHFAALALTLMIAALIFAAPAVPLRTAAARWLLALTVFGPIVAIALAEYIIWTPPGLATVYGIQPRYLLPIFPFAAYLLKSLIPVRKLRLRTLLTASLALTLIAATLPFFAEEAFYRAPLVQVLRLNLR